MLDGACWGPTLWHGGPGLLETEDWQPRQATPCPGSMAIETPRSLKMTCSEYRVQRPQDIIHSSTVSRDGRSNQQFRRASSLLHHDSQGPKQLMSPKIGTICLVDSSATTSSPRNGPHSHAPKARNLRIRLDREQS